MPSYFTQKTVRQLILEKVFALYSAVDEDSYGVKFSSVRHGPLGNPDSTKLCTIGVVPGEERKSDLYPLITSLFDVTIEFSVTSNRGETPGLLYESFLGVVQQVMYDNTDLGGLCILLSETRSTQDMYTYADKTMMGAVTFEVHYRHNTQTVYSPDPSV